MRHVHRLRIIIIGIALLLALTPSSALASIPLQGNSVTIAAQQTVNGAVSAAGGTIVAVSATPTRLMVLDTATFAVTFSAARPAAGPYTAILELQPRGGGPTRSAVKGGFHLYRGQPLRVYWEWRAGTALPPGVYTVRAQLCDVTRRIVDRHGAYVARCRTAVMLSVAPYLQALRRRRR